MYKTTMSDLELLFGNKYRSGVYSVDIASPKEAIKQAAKSAGHQFFYLDGQMIHSKKDFFNACAKELRFPPYFGFNLDALNDCLGDMLWFSEPLGFVLLYSYADVFYHSDGVNFAHIMDVLEHSTEFRRKKAKQVKPMYMLLHSSGEGYFMPLLGRDV